MTGERAATGVKVLSGLVLAALFAACIVAVEVLRLPEPGGQLVFDHALVGFGDQPARPADLPHSWSRIPAGPFTVRYEIGFTLEEPPGRIFHLYFPAVRQEIAASLNGETLEQLFETPWSAPAQGSTVLLRIPADLLRGGANQLEIALTRSDGAIPGYLSKAHLGEAGSVVTTPWLSNMLGGQGRATAFALHLLIAVGLLTLWSARRRDPVLQWLVLLGAASLGYAATDINVLPEWVERIRPMFVLLLPSFGLMALGLAMAIADVPRPVWLRYLVVLVPAALFLAFLPSPPPIRLVLVMAGAAVALGGHLIGSLVLFRAFMRQGRWELGVLAVPFLLVTWIGLRDILVTLGIREAGFLLSNYVRSLTLLAVLVLLMHRLATSLNRIDAANDLLRRRLAEQEAELSALHERERQRAAHTVREEERRRLMHDLHDGLSGHLVSIIALAERDGQGSGRASPDAIERAAREALDDLRLVINSLDLGDSDLPLALAGFRERLAPRLRRLGIDLDWSMDGLPEVSGVTPGGALTVLRILQEAVTNAIKHGAGGPIAVRGSAGDDGAAILTVRNTAAADAAPGTGHGLGNMQRRARQLGGGTTFAIADGEAVLTLSLPARLVEP